jgi:hypothetical protein
MLVFEHFGHRQILVLGMTQFLPERTAAGEQPEVEFRERAEPLLTRFLPEP